ncbi:Sel1 repeat [Slackia heliotrinireducens]|uniref:Sel1 repeat protein n=1 Tax=Slackia heliotrinireducens (strain ATCC 29202 / DSM 20476 / NCTC 11029 / RHS 1) TaxID=471855 RepID=C7N145_SLAHD|nr:tetratricopeptide repeat protein [Slackia heliotrinireducens]ACV23267.1 Sel1 repeat protein [Slackia heliotrinireducens DSM 20476]VEH02424.1 Sel1 repeat [Slackia heliotrinireducens]
MIIDHEESAGPQQCPIEVLNDSSNSLIPHVLVSHPKSDEPDSTANRTNPTLYPPPNNRDDEGYLALKEGALYYVEGMRLLSSEKTSESIACFQAAEIMYLHAASRSNIQSFANLGYLYHYDRCAGAYFNSVDPSKAESPSEALISAVLELGADERAYYCFLHAARRGHAESCYMLGDLASSGKGCQKDEKTAFEYYMRAHDLSLKYDSVIWGNAAVRIAMCYERGIGCQKDLNEAHAWYARAIKGLDSSTHTNGRGKSKMLDAAKNGMKRVEQRLS